MSCEQLYSHSKFINYPNFTRVTCSTNNFLHNANQSHSGLKDKHYSSTSKMIHFSYHQLELNIYWLPLKHVPCLLKKMHRNYEINTALTRA